MTATVHGVCPRCAGTGIEGYADDDAPITCARCGGSGDLDTYRLMEAYRMGRADAFDEVRVALGNAIGCLDQSLESMGTPTPPYVNADVLRARLGG